MTTATRVLTAVRIVLLVFMVIAAAVGISGHVIEDKDNNEQYMSLWKYKDSTGSETDVSDLACSTLKDRFRATSGISIIALIFYFFMLVISIADLLLGGIDFARAVAFNALNLISFVFILTSWAGEGHFYHSDWCAGFKPVDQNYKIGYGLALLVVVWVVQIVVSIVWIVTKVLDKPAGPVLAAKNEPSNSP